MIKGEGRGHQRVYMCGDCGIFRTTALLLTQGPPVLSPNHQCFAVRSLGWVEVPEEDLVPGKSSIAVNNCIQQLAQTRSRSQPPDGAWGEVSWPALHGVQPKLKAEVVVPELPISHGDHLYLSSRLSSVLGRAKTC